MRSLRRISTFALLAVYGAVGLLGHGLHLFDPHGGHHHAVVRTESAGHGHEHHAHAEHGHQHSHACHAETLAHEPAVLESSSTCCDEGCSVCDFLAQARSAAPQVTTPFEWQHVATEVTELACQSTFQAVLGLHAPRGPPILEA